MRVIVLSEKAQKFRGVEYRLYGNYFHRRTKSDVAERYLHRAVWVHHHGPIPEGHHIHHRNHDRSNNQVGNLEAIKAGEHLEAHKRAWNRTPEAKRLHRALGLRNVHRTHANIKTFVCVECGKPYEKADCGTNKYCSLGCSRRADAKARKLRGGYTKEQCVCLWCGGTFMARKGRGSPTCSRSCKAYRWHARKRAAGLPHRGGRRIA